MICATIKMGTSAMSILIPARSLTAREKMLELSPCIGISSHATA